MSFDLHTEAYTVSSATAKWVPIPRTCRCVKAVAVVTTAVTVVNAVVTISDGTTTIGTITCTFTGSAIGDTLEMSFSANVKLDPDTPMRVLSDGGATAGAIAIVFTFSDFLAG